VPRARDLRLEARKKGTICGGIGYSCGRYRKPEESIPVFELVLSQTPHPHSNIRTIVRKSRTNAAQGRRQLVDHPTGLTNGSLGTVALALGEAS